MSRKPTRMDEWNNEAVALLLKHKSHDERVQMDGPGLLLFWAEYQEKLSRCPSTSDSWQLFHSACTRYIGPSAYRF